MENIKKIYMLQTVNGVACCSGNIAFSTISCLFSLLGFTVGKTELREILFLSVGVGILLSSIEQMELITRKDKKKIEEKNNKIQGHATCATF